MDQPGNNVSEQLWCSRGMIVTVRGPGDAEVSVRVPQPFARIGSDRYAEVCLPQGDLLPCNLYLHATANGIFCLGLSESAPNGWLTPHTRAEIGPYRIKAVFDDEGPAPSAELDDLRKKRLSPGAAPQLKIRDRSGNREVVELAIDRPLTLVGRRTPSSLRMTHRTVSRVHCVLYWSGDSLWAIDLLSANGTLLDKRPIEAAPWSAGQKLILGDFRIHYAETNGQHQSPPFPKLASTETGSGASRSAGRRRSRAAKRREKVSAPRPPVKSVRKPADSLAMPTGERRDSKVDAPQTGPPADLPERVRPVNGDLAAPSDAPLKLANGELAASESAIACREQHLVRAETPDAANPAQSDRETTESERQLLEALRMLAACNPDLGAADGELPPALVQALLAMVQQALWRANRAKLAEAKPACLPGIEQRLAIGRDSSNPAALLEDELSLVSLTLVKARRSVETGLELAAPNVERLIGAIEGLEKHILQLVQATQDRGASNDSTPQLAAPTAGPALDDRTPEICPEAPSLGDSAALTDFTGGKQPGGVARTEQSRSEPPLSAAENEPALRPANRTAVSPPFAPASPLLDDAMLSRLVSFKTKQDFDIRQRRIFWTATAAVAVFLILAATGVAKFFLSNPAPEGHASQYSLQEFAKVME